MLLEKYPFFRLSLNAASDSPTRVLLGPGLQWHVGMTDYTDVSSCKPAGLQWMTDLNHRSRDLSCPCSTPVVNIDQCRLYVILVNSVFKAPHWFDGTALRWLLICLVNQRVKTAFYAEDVKWKKRKHTMTCRPPSYLWMTYLRFLFSQSKASVTSLFLQPQLKSTQ